MMAMGRFAAVIIAAAVCPLVLAGAGQAAGMRVLTGARAAASQGTWHTAIRVPGTGAGGNVNVGSVSCGSAGNCSAGGSFLANEVNGRWDNAIEVPGIAALNGGELAEVASVSCASAGNCSAAGHYNDSTGALLPFVVGEVNGRWDNAIEVPGIAALSGGGRLDDADTVSCAPAGNCSAGGQYAAGSGLQAFVASEVNGRWGNAIEVPGTAALNKGGWAEVYSVSCTSAGDCSAGGTYVSKIGPSGGGIFQAFVVSEVDGRWGNAIEVPGTAALNKGGLAEAGSVSCVSAGNCSAGGYYRDASGNEHPFVVSEVKGVWRTAVKVTGIAALSAGSGLDEVDSVSCGSAGNCSAGGYYNGSGPTQAFVVSQANGRWGNAIEVPGLAALNTGGYALIESVSCASAGNCSAGGTYSDGSFHGQAFVDSEVNGRWGNAIEVPGTAALNQTSNANAQVSSVSCRPAGDCSAAGMYTGSSGYQQAFVDSKS